jgi:predicted nuclease of predicted toxin-antitoxin system
MKFLVDTQLPPRLARHLSSKGHDSIHTTFFPEGQFLKDDEIIEIAKNENRIIISKDSDFIDNYLLKGSPPKVMLLEFGNIGNKELITIFNQYLSIVIETFDEGNDMVLFRRDVVVGY